MITRIKTELRDGKQFLSFSFLRGSSHVLSFLIPMFLAKFLSPEVFGSYTLSMVVVYFFASLLLRSSNMPFIVYANEEFKQTGKISKAFSVQSIILMGSILAFLLIYLFLGDLIVRFGSLTKTQGICLIGAFVGWCVHYCAGSVFLGMNRKIMSAAFESILSVVSLGYIIILYLHFTLSLENIFIMFLITPLVVTPVFITFSGSRQLLPFVFDRNLFTQILHDTKWQFMGVVTVYLLSWGDNLVLRKFINMSDIGVYNFGYQFFKGALMLISMVAGYFTPFIAQHIQNPVKIKNYLFVKRPKIFSLVLGGVVILFFIVPVIINRIYGPDYQGAINVFRILLVGAVFAGYNVFYAPIFASLKRFRFMQLTQTTVVAINIGLDYLFIQWFGYVGAAIATTIAYLFALIISETYFRKWCAPLLR